MKKQNLKQNKDEDGKCSEQTRLVVPDDVKELWLQREVESLIGDAVHPSKVCLLVFSYIFIFNQIFAGKEDLKNNLR